MLFGISKKQIAMNLFSGFFLSLLVGASAAHAGSVSDICMAIANYDNSAAIRCSGLIGNNHFDQGAVDVCASIVTEDYNTAISCISAISNHAYDDTQATPICAKVQTYDNTSAVRCLQIAADLSFPNNSAAVCAKIVETDYQGAIACLKSTGQTAPVKPACPATAIATSSLKAALQSLDAYDITTARKNLVQLLSGYENCQ
jgi:hypothetical protein